MNIQINEKYRIISDSLNIIIQHLPEPKEGNEPTWKSISFHRTLEQAITWLFDREIRLSEANEIHKLMECITDARNTLTSALSRSTEVYSA